jgi:DNA-binding MarR family transcriptional regulator
MPDPSLEGMLKSFHQFDRSVARLSASLWTSEEVLPCTVAESRVLCVLGEHPRIELKELRRTLMIDAGFLSRLVKSLESRQLLARDRSPADGRRQIVRLTERGRAVQQVLGEHFEKRVGALLHPMSEWERDQFLTAMDTICEAVELHL